MSPTHGPADLLDDVGAEMIQSGIDVARVQAVLTRVRARWAGCDVYIRQRPPIPDDAIRQALAAGRPTAEIASAVGVSERTIRRRRSRWFS